MMALSSSRLAYLGGRPVALRWGRSGSILAHCSSVRSVGYSLLGVVGVFISVSIFFLPVSGHPLSEAKNLVPDVQSLGWHETQRESIGARFFASLRMTKDGWR